MLGLKAFQYDENVYLLKSTELCFVFTVSQMLSCSPFQYDFSFLPFALQHDDPLPVELVRQHPLDVRPGEEERESAVHADDEVPLAEGTSGAGQRGRRARGGEAGDRWKQILCLPNS